MYVCVCLFKFFWVHDFICRTTNQSTDVAAPTWVVVSGHYPVYSTGEHADSEELIENLLPLFEVHYMTLFFMDLFFLAFTLSKY